MPYTALQNLRIVMVETSHPGNIGSAARAMKTMGIKDLRLVTPRKPYSQETWALASGANDIVEQAKMTQKEYMRSSAMYENTLLRLTTRYYWALLLTIFKMMQLWS